MFGLCVLFLTLENLVILNSEHETFFKIVFYCHIFGIKYKINICLKDVNLWHPFKQVG